MKYIFDKLLAIYPLIVNREREREKNERKKGNL